MSPIAPFYSDWLYRNLNEVSRLEENDSIHLSDFPVSNEVMIDKDLEDRMQIAQDISSIVLGLRKKVNIKVRQPLNKILIPVLNENFQKQVEAVGSLIQSEVNVKEIEFLKDTSDFIVKKLRPNFKILGKKLGPLMKDVSKLISEFGQEEIMRIEQDGMIELAIKGETVQILKEEVEIITEDIPGWLVANIDELTVALDVTISDELRKEGNARELINKVQRIRKEKGFKVTDRITIKMADPGDILASIESYKSYICSQILAEEINFVNQLDNPEQVDINGIIVNVLIEKKD